MYKYINYLLILIVGVGIGVSITSGTTLSFDERDVMRSENIAEANQRAECAQELRNKVGWLKHDVAFSKEKYETCRKAYYDATTNYWSTNKSITYFACSTGDMPSLVGRVKSKATGTEHDGVLIQCTHDKEKWLIKPKRDSKLTLYEEGDLFEFIHQQVYLR